MLSVGYQAISQWLLVRLMSSTSWWSGFLAGGLYWPKHFFLFVVGTLLMAFVGMLVLPMIPTLLFTPLKEALELPQLWAG